MIEREKHTTETAKVEKPPSAAKKDRGYWQNIENIRKEAKEFWEKHGTLSQQKMSRSGQSGLVHAISEIYPGGMRQLRSDLGLESSHREKGYWTTERVEIELRRVYMLCGDLNTACIKEYGQRGFEKAMRQHFGGIHGAKIFLGIPIADQPSQNWHDPHFIEEEARAFLQKYGELTRKKLYAENRADLFNAIIAHYPGGLTGLKEFFREKIEEIRVGMWTAEKIEQEILMFREQTGRVSLAALVKYGREDLAMAIKRYYPGGHSALRKKIGLSAVTKREIGYWTIQKIEEVARDFVERHGHISARLLIDHGYSSLLVAITNKYPGKMNALKEKIGVAIDRMPMRYWQNIDNIERAAAEFFRKHGSIGERELRENGLYNLVFAITKYYPGKMKALREKMIESIKVLDFSEQILVEYEALLEQGIVMSLDQFIRSRSNE